LHLENKQKMTDTPTAERLQKAFADVSLTVIKTATGGGHAAAADALCSITTGHPVTAGLEDVFQSTA
jgi:hypothetical protein